MVSRFSINSTFFMMAALLMIFIGCDWISPPGPQPSGLEDYEYEAKLNVFSVLRPASDEGISLSYVHVEYAYPTANIPDEIAIEDAEVMVYRMIGGVAVDSVRFLYAQPDSVFDSHVYRNGAFDPESGGVYCLACRKAGFPTLTGTTMMPETPEVVDASVRLDDNRLRFSIRRDPSAVVYDVYSRIGGIESTVRVRRPEEGDIPVDIAFHRENQARGTVVIYAYDALLSEYIAYNISIKPNTYRKGYSTVENGYGCFGSLNLTEWNIDF